MVWLCRQSQIASLTHIIRTLKVSDVCRSTPEPVTYLLPCSSRNHNPVHFPHCLSWPRLPRQLPSAPSTNEKGPFKENIDDPLSSQEKKMKELNELLFFSFVCVCVCLFVVPFQNFKETNSNNQEKNCIKD